MTPLMQRWDGWVSLPGKHFCVTQSEEVSFGRGGNGNELKWDRRPQRSPGSVL